jgi:predicted nucleic acid-binding protein
LASLHRLPESRIYKLIGYLREVAEIVPLNPLLSTPIRDVNDVIVMQTAMLGEADIICTKDRDFYEPPAAEFLSRLGIRVLGEIALLTRLRR